MLCCSHMTSINIIESTDPKDRPTEAVAQLRDIAEWLRADGYVGMAADADELADDIASTLIEET